MIDSFALKQQIINSYSNYDLQIYYQGNKIIPPNQSENFLEMIADVFSTRAIEFLKNSVVNLLISGNQGSPGFGISPIIQTQIFLNLFNPNFLSLNWTGDQASNFVKSIWEIFYNYITANAQIEVRTTDNIIGVSVGTAQVTSIIFDNMGFYNSFKSDLESRLNIAIRQELDDFCNISGNYINNYNSGITATIPIAGGTPVSPPVPVSGAILGHLI